MSNDDNDNSDDIKDNIIKLGDHKDQRKTTPAADPTGGSGISETHRSIFNLLMLLSTGASSNARLACLKGTVNGEDRTMLVFISEQYDPSTGAEWYGVEPIGMLINPGDMIGSPKDPHMPVMEVTQEALSFYIEQAKAFGVHDVHDVGFESMTRKPTADNDDGDGDNSGGAA